MDKEKKAITGSFYVLNIKLLSNERTGDTAYRQLFRDLYKNKVNLRVWADRSFIIRTQYEKTDQGGFDVLYGSLSSFTPLDTHQWFNLEKMEVVDYEIPPNLFPNLKELDYFFIPEAHRLCIQKKQGASVNTVKKFLEEGLKRVARSNEDIQVEVETDIDAIEKILHAKAITKIKIDISYSNQDTNEEHVRYIDQQLRLMQARSFSIVAEPDHHGTLSKESLLLDGALGLAKSNGVVEARIIDDADRKQVIRTTNYPQVVNVSYESDDNKPTSVLRKVLNIFRP